jgi:hypothetical protein
MISNGIAVADPGPPSLPLTGWEQVLESNYKEMAKQIIQVTDGKFTCTYMFMKFVTKLVSIGLLYTYLAEGVGSTNVSGAFRALKRGFNHWASGRIDHLYVHYNHPVYCHVKCDMIPSMKSGIYHVYILLVKTGDLASRVEKATCDCVAGYVAADGFGMV